MEKWVLGVQHRGRSSLEAGTAQVRGIEGLPRGSNWRHVEHGVQQIFRRFAEGLGGVEVQGGL